MMFSIYIYPHICIYMYMCVYIYMYILYVYIICMYILLCMFTSRLICSYMYVCVYMCVCVCVCASQIDEQDDDDPLYPNPADVVRRMFSAMTRGELEDSSDEKREEDKQSDKKGNDQREEATIAGSSGDPKEYDEGSSGQMEQGDEDEVSDSLRSVDDELHVSYEEFVLDASVHGEMVDESVYSSDASLRRCTLRDHK